MIIEALKELTEGKNLKYNTTKEVISEITKGNATEAQIAAFLTALKIKGETVEEITAAAEVIKDQCIKTVLNTNNTLDIVGTGGDMSNTFNISTTTAFVTAAGGVPVAKHGNRAWTSKSGSIDVLEALGINVNKTSEEECKLFKDLNLCFMFAINHHPSFKYAANVRKEIKLRTLFNILGPLSNPANAQAQLFGVYNEELVKTLAQVISNLGVKNVLVVHGKDGIDEATLTDDTLIAEGRNGIIETYSINPEDFGFKKCKKEDIEGGNANDNAQIIKDIFTLKEKGAKRDIVLLNSALAFYTFNKTKTIKEGVTFAKYVIDSGLALDKLNKYIELSRG